MNAVEMIVGPVAVEVGEGGIGGVFAAVQRPPLKSPPLPETLTTVPAGHGLTNVVPGPGFAQSTGMPVLRIEPSTASQPDGAARTSSPTAPAMDAAIAAHASVSHRCFLNVML